MLRWVKLSLYLVLVVLLQVAVLPVYLEDPFKPNLIIILVCYLALREDISFLGGFVAYLLGLIQSTFSGINFGLAGISALLIYMILRKMADQLYTDSDQLMIVVVFIASIIDATVSFLLILLFSASPGIYNSILTNMVPQALVNAMVASLFFGITSWGKRADRP